MDAVKDNYVDGGPRHIKDPKSSVFSLVDCSRPRPKSAELLTMFEKQAIVMTNFPTPDVDWTPESMAKFGFLNKKQTIYGETPWNK